LDVGKYDGRLIWWTHFGCRCHLSIFVGVFRSLVAVPSGHVCRCLPFLGCGIFWPCLQVSSVLLVAVACVLFGEADGWFCAYSGALSIMLRRSNYLIV
jgi:hypothetical protein